MTVFAFKPPDGIRWTISDGPLITKGGRPLANFSADDCAPLEGDEIAKFVTWNTDGNRPFSAKPVRVRFDVKDADLYSFRFLGSRSSD